jgi:hypothetical protein
MFFPNNETKKSKVAGGGNYVAVFEEILYFSH